MALRSDGSPWCVFFLPLNRYFDALQEIATVRVAEANGEVMPDWVPFSDFEVCQLCKADFSWASTSRSEVSGFCQVAIRSHQQGLSRMSSAARRTVDVALLRPNYIYRKCRCTALSTVQEERATVKICACCAPVV